MAVQSLVCFAMIMLIIASVYCADDPKNDLEQTALFKSGEGDYHTYRIPALIVTQKGSLLAFCEGRKSSASDTGEINVLLRRSFDNGKTWTPIQVVAADGPNTMGNPCPVVDRTTGVIWLLMTRNLGSDRERDIMDGTSESSRQVWISKSSDEGATWSEPAEITETTKDPNWTWYATGPGVGIQMKSGRLVIPCDYAEKDTKIYGSHIIYSDDNGKTWRLGGTISPNCNECQVVELEDGSLMMNMRSYHGENRRAVSRSEDGGLTWSEATLDEALIEPVCQASFLRYTYSSEHGKSRILLSNPASESRENMTVRMSYDEAKTWPVKKRLYAGPSAYSCLAVLPDMSIACLYERGDDNPYETITFAKFALDWLTDGEDSLE